MVIAYFCYILYIKRFSLVNKVNIPTRYSLTRQYRFENIYDAWLSVRSTAVSFDSDCTDKAASHFCVDSYSVHEIVVRLMNAEKFNLEYFQSYLFFHFITRLRIVRFCFLSSGTIDLQYEENTISIFEFVTILKFLRIISNLVWNQPECGTKWFIDEFLLQYS